MASTASLTPIARTLGYVGRVNLTEGTTLQHDFRLLAVDGSTGRLPNTEAVDQHFGRPSGSGVPLARFSRLYDVLNHVVVQADMAPYRMGERELAGYYLLNLEEKDLLLYDRGYPAFWLFAFHHVEQHHYCARLKHDFHPEVTRFFWHRVKRVKR